MMLSRATRYVRMSVSNRSISFIDRFVEGYSISPCRNSLFSVRLTALMGGYSLGISKSERPRDHNS
jgi:hypothetical protein